MEVSLQKTIKSALTTRAHTSSDENDDDDDDDDDDAFFYHWRRVSHAWGAKDALCKVATMNIGLEDTLAYYSPEAHPFWDSQPNGLTVPRASSNN